MQDTFIQYTLMQDPNHLALDKNDCVISVGKNRFQELGIEKAEQLIGKNLFEVLKKSGGAPDIFIQQKEEIKRQILTGIIDQTWILVSNKFAHNHKLHITHHKALRDETNQIIGCIIIPHQFTLCNQTPLLAQAETPKLSIRQNEIIFLLAIGMSQKEIATLYQLHRGTIVKTIGVICDKFNIAGANENKLIELAYKLGYGIPPYHLLKVGLFQFDTPYISNFQLRNFLFD